MVSFLIRPTTDAVCAASIALVSIALLCQWIVNVNMVDEWEPVEIATSPAAAARGREGGSSSSSSRDNNVAVATCTLIFPMGRVVEKNASNELFPLGVFVAQEDQEGDGTNRTVAPPPPVRLECDDGVARTWPITSNQK